MTKRQRNDSTPCLWASGSLLIVSMILFFLHWISPYLPYLTAAILLLSLSLVNLILLIFRKDPPNGSAQPIAPQPPVSLEGITDPKERRAAERKARTAARLSDLEESLFRISCRIYRPLQYLLLLIAVGGAAALLIFGLIAPPAQSTLPPWQLVLLVALFVGVIVLDKLCKHTSVSDEGNAMLLRNARVFFALSKFLLAVLAACAALRLLGIFDATVYVVSLFVALFCYVEVMVILSLTVRILRKELSTAPGIVILLPFLNADIRELAVLSFLEENTGITLRSLWSIRFAKSIVPYTLAGAALLFWLSTGIVYVQSHQQAAVYRLGVLQDEVLAPGLHLTLPYPFDKTEIHDTETINKITIGYKSTADQDNLWTEAHGESEYRLLLGSGNELVSINLRIEYRISDLKQYLTYGAQPERILEATAYELVTERTINADLETILSSNRETFAKTLQTQLTAAVEERNTGLEVINVIMESIHPPVEVAQVYQAFIGAEIDAEKMILQAQGKAVETVAKAETLFQQIINDARVNHADAVASAHSEVAEFTAAVEASADHPDEYVYYKYLSAIQTAYRQSALVIVGNGVDTSRLYFGKFTTAVS